MYLLMGKHLQVELFIQWTILTMMKIQPWVLVEVTIRYFFCSRIRLQKAKDVSLVSLATEITSSNRGTPMSNTFGDLAHLEKKVQFQKALFLLRIFKDLTFQRKFICNSGSFTYFNFGAEIISSSILHGYKKPAQTETKLYPRMCVYTGYSPHA